MHSLFVQLSTSNNICYEICWYLLWSVLVQNFKFQWFIIIITAIRLKGKYRSLAVAISLSFIVDKDCSNNN